MAVDPATHVDNPVEELRITPRQPQSLYGYQLLLPLPKPDLMDKPPLV